tara:strand:+ start:192 stop:512 length:321 start_codon:yes stop_codon:yes gene_type:complete
MQIFTYQKMETIISTCQIVAEDFSDAEKIVESNSVKWNPKDNRTEYDVLKSEDIEFKTSKEFPTEKIFTTRTDIICPKCLKSDSMTFQDADGNFYNDAYCLDCGLY